jgi:AraC-like DNA-binding protein
MYRERPSRLDSAAVWTREVAGDGPHRVLPDGCIDLIWHGGTLLVAGPDTRAHLVASPTDARYVGLRFSPGVGPAVLDVPADVLRDRRIPLADLWGAAAARRAADLVDGSATALEELALTRLAERPPDRLARHVAARLAAGRSVRAIAAEVALSERQLRRRCEAAFGYGPKTLARILRFTTALNVVSNTGSCRPEGTGRQGTSVAAAAFTAGYADQAHFAREVKALAGVPLRQLAV